MAADIQHGRASFSRSVLLCIRRKAEGDYILSYHMDTAYARAKATKSGVCRPKPVTPLRHCRTLVKRLTGEAIEALAPFGGEGGALCWLAEQLAGREK